MIAIDWDRLARFYGWQLTLERQALRALLDLLEVTEGESLLDVATGTAALLRELANRPVRPARAVGLDRSARMLAAADELPIAWKLVRADAERLPFADASFDVATASYLLHVLDPEARLRVLAELRRVLRIGGRLGVVTVAAPRTVLGRWLSWPIREAAKRSDGALAGLRPFDPVADLAAVGFGVTAQHRVTRGYPSLCVVASRG